MVLQLVFILLNINIHFCEIFLAENFVISIIIRIFAASVLAKPLNNAQIVRGVFIYTHLNMANLIPFTKRFESSENLVNLLESRGLQIYDRNKAIQYLDNIGYYRLSAYMYPLLKMPKTAHLYKEGSSFKKVMMLYRFDKKLRLLMFNEIEKIEIAIRRAVMQITADMTGNPFGLLTLLISWIVPGLMKQYELYPRNTANPRRSLFFISSEPILSHIHHRGF